MQLHELTMREIGYVTGGMASNLPPPSVAPLNPTSPWLWGIGADPQPQPWVIG